MYARGELAHIPKGTQNIVLIFHMDEVDRMDNDKQMVLLY